MNIRNNAWKITILIVVTHCIIGNLIGIYTDGQNVIGYLFLPYTFISGMSTFAGWDTLSFVLELGSFGLMMAVFYPIGLILEKNKEEGG